MLSRSCLEQLNLVSQDDFVLRIPRVMTKLTESDDDDKTQSSSFYKEKRIVVANKLPLLAKQNNETRKWQFDYDNDSLVLQLKDGFPPETEVIYVGSLNADIDVADQDDVGQYLLENFQCVPTFITTDLYNNFYHGFCKHYLWPLFHYMLPMTQSHASRFDRSHWQAYLKVNKIFADKIREVINPDEDYVWIHDYHLMLLPTFLRKQFHRVKLGFFLHSPFPSSEIYRTLPVKEEILRALLNCDLIGFHTFDYARHFLSCCGRMLGLDYQSKRGYIGLDYYGRTVSLKILPVGIHMGQIRSLLALDDTAAKVKELKNKFNGKIVILGVDDMDMFKGIGLKFSAFGRLLEENEELVGKVVLVQITNPARSSGKDVQDVQQEAESIQQQINKQFGKPDYEPIVHINRRVTAQEKVCYCSIAECCVVNAVRDGMNLIPYKYTAARQSNSVLDNALGLRGSSDDDSPVRKSVLVVSEFIGCSPSLSGAIRVNPWNIDQVSEAMRSAIEMPECEKQARHEKHFKYINSHDVTYWARSFHQDFERACKDHYMNRCWGVGFGFGFRVVALGPNFRKLAVEAIASAYRKTNHRLILLDYDGTMMPQASVDKAPSSRLICLLNSLCEDPKNIVFVVSGRGRAPLSNWFSPCERLGISAEHGFFTRWTKDSPWEICSVVMDFEWKKIAQPVMQLYTETTDGSFIEQKECALVWHFQQSDLQFGSSQAKELLDHLENVLANEPVVVKRGQHIVEVKPQGISKGTVVESLIDKMKRQGRCPDLLLCIGDDRSDEDMFESIANTPCLPETAQVFACTVGQKPSKAKYYLDDTVEVIKLLQRLSLASEELETSKNLYPIVVDEEE